MATPAVLPSAVCGFASVLLFIFSLVIVRGGTRTWSRRVFFLWLFTKSIWLLAASAGYLATDMVQFELTQNIFYSLIFPITFLTPVFSISFNSPRIKEYFSLAMVCSAVMMVFWLYARPYAVQETAAGFSYTIWEPLVLPSGLFLIFSFTAAFLNLWLVSRELEGDRRRRLRNLSILIFMHMALTIPFGFYGQLTGSSGIIPAVDGVVDSFIFTLMLKVYRGGKDRGHEVVREGWS